MLLPAHLVPCPQSSTRPTWHTPQSGPFFAAPHTSSSGQELCQAHTSPTIPTPTFTNVVTTISNHGPSLVQQFGHNDPIVISYKNILKNFHVMISIYQPLVDALQNNNIKYAHFIHNYNIIMNTFWELMKNYNIFTTHYAQAATPDINMVQQQLCNNVIMIARIIWHDYLFTYSNSKRTHHRR